MKYTDAQYNQMVERCKKIASVFINHWAAKRAPLDTMNNIDDVDEYEVSQEEIEELFEQFKETMGLECELGFFGDNEVEDGRYSEHMDAVTLPLCIGCYNERKIVEHMTHELYHAFQYAAICNPTDYPCFDDVTIKKWDYEFHHYVSGAKDMTQYLGQEIERTARDFGALLANI